MSRSVQLELIEWWDVWQGNEHLYKQDVYNLRPGDWVKKLAEVPDGDLSYFIGYDDYSFVKIGKSNKKGIRGRFMQLNGANPQPLRLWAVSSHWAETTLHAKFKKSRYAKEWFRYTPDIETFIENDPLLVHFTYARRANV